MSHNLADALKQDVPEPPHSLDPDTVIALHRHGRQRRRTAAVVGSLAVAAIAAPTALLQADLGSPDTPPAGGGAVQVSALEQTEPLPNEWLQAQQFAFLPEEASRVTTTSGDGAVYLWADGDDLCMVTLFGVSTSEVPGSGGGTCKPPAALLGEGLVGGISDTSGEFTGTVRHLVVVVPDGYTEVTLGTLTEPVANNVAVFSWDYLANVDALARSTDGLVLTGEGRSTVTIPTP